MNKFEALKQFQAWPPEWQRLCAECWIETGDDRPALSTAASNVAQVWCHADQVAMARKLLEPVAMVAHKSVSAGMAQEQPKAAAKVAAAKPARNFMRYTRDEISEVDAHLSEGRGPTEISVMMVRKHPNKRTREAWRKMAQWVRKHGFLVSMNQAVEAEVE
jgi:hypothetical protein